MTMRSFANIIASLGRGRTVLGSVLLARPVTAAGGRPVMQDALLVSRVLGHESTRSTQSDSAAPAAVARWASSRLRIVLGASLLLSLVFAIYYPILPGSFLMDDEKLVRWENPIVNNTLGPLSIWFRGDFALSTLVFWLQWLAWGENPMGYHVVNLLLQTVSAILVWRLLTRLKVPGAWLAAALFAIHPVCVASVGRIAELKNTLSLPFFLLSFLF